MKIILTFTLLMIPGVVSSISVTGYSGGGVTITCKYDEGYAAYIKYFCKGQWSDCTNQIKTNEKDKWVHSGRFSLYDDTRSAVFNVTIRDLTELDSDTYWCGTDISAKIDLYTEVNLKVITAPQRPTPIQIFTSTFYPDQTISSFSNTPPYLRTSDTIPQSSSITITDHQIISSTASSSASSVVIIVTAEALVLLLIAVPLIIVAVRKKMKNKGLLSSSTVEFNPVFYEQIKDTGRYCNPEDRDTITTVFYSLVS